MKDILLAVMQRLKEKVPDLQYIAEDWGQLDFYEERPPVKFPCALLSVSNAAFTSETYTVRQVQLTFQVRVADAPAVSGTMSAPESYRQRAFAIFDLMDEIGAALYGFETDAFSAIEQKAITNYSREDAIREYAMTFETRYAVVSE